MVNLALVFHQILSCVLNLNQLTHFVNKIIVTRTFRRVVNTHIIFLDSIFFKYIEQICQIYT